MENKEREHSFTEAEVSAAFSDATVPSKKTGYRTVEVKDSEGNTTFLTPLQHKFVNQYCKHGNAAQAARECGAGTKSTSDAQYRNLGYSLLNQPGVKEAISAVQKQLVIRSGLDGNEVINTLRDIIVEARTAHKYDAAVKAAISLGEIVGILGKTKGIKEDEAKASKGSAFNHSDEEADIDSDIEKMLSTIKGEA